MTSTVTDAAIMLQAIAGCDKQEITSQQMTVPKYTANLRSKTSSLRLGLAHEFFFESLDPEIEATTSEAISVLEKLTAGVKPVTLPLNNVCACVTSLHLLTHRAWLLPKTPPSSLSIEVRVFAAL
jgi:Asp-tRNA(Asn)/Glu-tRNA(Gln) amidotransferase A subunit family amidase